MVADMQVIAIKLTEDTPSIKIVYSKKSRFYMRTGEDGFKVGTPIENVNSLYQYGFRKVENPPRFIDAQDIVNNIGKFGLKPQGSVVYSG